MNTNQFNSDTYVKFELWQKIIFWVGILSFIHPAYWLVRLIIYLVVQREPLKRRVGFYTMQTYIFGWITSIVLAILIVVLTVIAITAGIIALWLIPVASVRA